MVLQQSISGTSALLVGLARAALPHHNPFLSEMWAGSILSIPAPQAQLAKVQYRGKVK